ncbi:MAG: GNAT family N-acetyltransferase [Clostridiaceae bacterium]|nr:GNAT family N-acetyltransferase [Clostridiaceae bacterium]
MIEIVPFQVGYFEAWRQMSLEWLKEYDLLEPEDFHLLDHPYETAIDAGGAIYIALSDGRPAGTVSLLPAGDKIWEIAKLTVRAEYRRHGIADRLMAAAISGIRERGGERALLFTNSRLMPAIALYRKWGFSEVPYRDSAYCESDRRFEKALSEAGNEIGTV